MWLYEVIGQLLTKQTVHRPKNIIEAFKLFQFNPSPAQWQVVKEFSRINILAAGARFGKSMLAGAIAASLVLQDAAQIWIVGPTYDLAYKEFSWAIKFLERAGFGPRSRYCRSYSSPSSGACVISYLWGSWIKTKSADHPVSLLGDELDLIIMAEGCNIPKQIFQRQLVGRLGPRKGCIFIPSTPVGDNWVYEMWQKGQIEEYRAEGYRSWKFSVLENPYFDKAEYERAKRILDDNSFKEQFEGEFVPAYGRVYPEFSRQTHVIEKMPVGWRHWPIIRGIDFGYTNPCAVVWIARNPEGIYYIFDEIYIRETTILDISKLIKEKNKDLDILFTVSDHGEDAHALKKYGVPTKNALKNIKVKGAHAGFRTTLQITKQFIKIDKKLNKPRLFILKNCHNIINEFTNYAWPKSKELKADVEYPLDKYSHSMDAIRYAVSYYELTYNKQFWKKLGLL